MVSQNCPAISQNLQIFVETLVDCSFINNFKNWRSFKILNGSSSQTFKKTLFLHIKLFLVSVCTLEVSTLI